MQIIWFSVTGYLPQQPVKEVMVFLSEILMYHLFSYKHKQVSWSVQQV